MPWEKYVIRENLIKIVLKYRNGEYIIHRIYEININLYINNF